LQTNTISFEQISFGKYILGKNLKANFSLYSEITLVDQISLLVWNELLELIAASSSRDSGKICFLTIVLKVGCELEYNFVIP